MKGLEDQRRVIDLATTYRFAPSFSARGTYMEIAAFPAFIDDFQIKPLAHFRDSPFSLRRKASFPRNSIEIVRQKINKIDVARTRCDIGRVFIFLHDGGSEFFLLEDVFLSFCQLTFFSRDVVDDVLSLRTHSICKNGKKVKN